MNRTVHFFATYYDQEYKALTLVNSLMNQTEKNWKLTICSNGDESLNRFADDFDSLYADDGRVNFKITEENTGYWGALNRKDFIENELEDNELLVNCSVEDYYVPKTVEFINKRNENFIYWDFTHHQFNYDTSKAITQPRMKKIDWGSFAVLGEYAKHLKMLPVNVKDESGEVAQQDSWINYFADGLFVEYMFAQNPAISNVRLPKILFIKN